MRDSNINSINYTPFHNESDIDRSSIGDKSYNPFVEGLERHQSKFIA